MSDISKRLNELERVAKANEPSDEYKKLYPLAPLEFTKLQFEQGKDAQVLTEIWHGVIDDYEQEHLDELHACLKANTLPPWRRILFLERLKKNTNSLEKRRRFDKEYGLPPDDKTDNLIKNLNTEIEQQESLEQVLTRRALERYKQYESEGKI